jgi:hypothetical protein
VLLAWVQLLRKLIFSLSTIIMRVLYLLVGRWLVLVIFFTPILNIILKIFYIYIVVIVASVG